MSWCQWEETQQNVHFLVDVLYIWLITCTTPSITPTLFILSAPAKFSTSIHCLVFRVWLYRAEGRQKPGVALAPEPYIQDGRSESHADRKDPDPSIPRAQDPVEARWYYYLSINAQICSATSTVEISKQFRVHEWWRSGWLSIFLTGILQGLG